MFITALITTVKTWRQTKCPLTDELIKMWYVCVYINIHTHTDISFWKNNIHTYTYMEYYSAIEKEWNNAIFSDVDGPRNHDSRWSKPNTERQMSYDIIYTWNLKKKKEDTNEPIYSTERDLQT